MRIDDRRLAYGLIATAVILGLLVYGRPLLVPLAFALLLWAVLNALTSLLRRWYFPAWLAWLAAFALIGAALYLIALVLANEAAALATEVPKYAARLQRLWTAQVPLEHLLPMVDFKALAKQSNIASLLGSAATMVGNGLIELTLAVIFVGFLLAEQRHLPGKLLRLEKHPGTQAESQQVARAIARQIQSYLGVCTILSVIMGALCYGLLSFLHVEFAGFWALIIFILTYVPTVGAIGTALPALMALAQFETLAPALTILVILGGAHLFLTNIVEPVMLGRSLNLSPLAIILSLTFWGIIWGIGGLFLAVPITGAIAIACRHLEGMGWFAEMVAGLPPPPHRRRGKSG
ncbi:MAG: AI-2E family transporter [Stellaceae bacterium]